MVFLWFSYGFSSISTTRGWRKEQTSDRSTAVGKAATTTAALQALEPYGVKARFHLQAVLTGTFGGVDSTFWES